MTGFASERRETRAGELTVSLRSVNHRGLDLHFHGGHEFSVFENEMRSLLKSSIGRGHVEVRFALERPGTAGELALNRATLQRYIAAFREISKELSATQEPDLNAFLTLRGVIEEAPVGNGLGAEFLPELLEAIDTCAAVLNEHREHEGGALRDEMSRHAAEIDGWSKEIAAVRAEALPYFRTRLRERLAELLDSSGISETRLTEEAALLADRSDIQEEIVRLGVHTRELKKILAEGGEVGKRLDFLLQEMNREINTTLAKSAAVGEPGLRITNLGLAIKANIERIREQALNLE